MINLYGSAMIRKYIWPFVEPILNNRAIEPLLLVAGSTMIIGGFIYTIVQIIM